MRIGLKPFSVTLCSLLALTSCAWLQQPPAPIKRGMTIETPTTNVPANPPSETIPLEPDTLPASISEENV